MTVHVSILNCNNGMRIGCLGLSAPERINAQNLAMVQQMHAALDEWASNPAVVLVLLFGAGEKGFCAGGDLKALFEAMQQGRHGEGEAFFAGEYRLCQKIREYGKPVLAWGHGLVMGGGWGLFSAASHRVVTPSSRLAMPECAIGLFPDVAASRWLPQLAGCGRFLALTGVQLNAADALFADAAQWALPDDCRHTVFAALSALPWRGDLAADTAQLDEFLDEFAARQPCDLPAGHLEPFWPLLRQLGHGSLENAVRRIAALAGHASPWLQHAAERVVRASPVSLWLAWQLQAVCHNLSLEETVVLETQLAACALRYGDFATGIHATLFARGQPPVWQVTGIAGLHIEELKLAFSPIFAYFQASTS